MKPQTIAVIGAGTMGAGIAQLAARHDCTVRLIDVNREALERGVASIARRFARSVEKGRIDERQRQSILSRINPGVTIEDLQDVQLVIEAVIENLDVKRKVFTALEKAAPPTAVLATNTSSLSITKIAESLGYPSRVIGMHFFNPAPIMPLVEIVSGRHSSASTVDAAFDAAKCWGKTPVRVKDTPGFIVNRVARGFYLESLRLLGEGVAGVDEIDLILRRHGGFKMGPFELMDLIGIDVNLAVSTSVYEQMGRPARLKPHEIQRLLVERGSVGRKAGAGFYDHHGDTPLAAFPLHRRSFEPSPLLQDAVQVFSTRAGFTEAGRTERYVLCRILSAIMNEAALAWSDGIATKEDIDIAMVKGTNYPKGPLAWAEEIGHRTVRGVLKGLNDSVGDDRYQPAPLFAEAQ